MKHVTLSVLVVAALLSAGCLGQGNEKTTSDPPTPEQRTVLEGWILDSEGEPVANATVSILQDNSTMTSASDGYYLFDTPPVAEVLVIVVEHTEYQIASRSITLEPDALTRLNFTLDLIPQKVATMSKLPHKGFMACQFVATLPTGDEPGYDCGALVPGNNDEWVFPVGPDLAGVVVEIQWQPRSPISDFFNATLETVDFGELNTVLAAAEGPSILRLQVSQMHAEKFYAQGGKIKLTVKPGTYAEEQEAGAGASLMLQQDFNVVASLFYVAPPPVGYSVTNS